VRQPCFSLMKTRGSGWTHMGVIVCLEEADEPPVFESTLLPESVDLFRGGAYVPGHFGDADFLLQDGALSAPLWLKGEARWASSMNGEKKSAQVVAGR
jgi:hypothetical protein